MSLYFSRFRRPQNSSPRFDFTPELRTLLQQARRAALQAGSSVVGSVHLVLAMRQMSSADGARLLTRLGVGAAALCTRFEAVGLEAAPTLRPDSGRSGAETPFSTGMKTALKGTMIEARDLGHTEIGSAHLVLGLLRDPRSKAGRMLREMGVTLDRARELVREGMPEGTTDFSVTIDEESDRQIYGQIVDQITEGIATGRLVSGDRLPPIRRLADQLDLAPGTVARAYRAMEEDGIVITDGVRGTFVALVGRTPASDPARPPLRDLFRPIVITGFHLGATPADLRQALDEAMEGIYPADR